MQQNEIPCGTLLRFNKGLSQHFAVYVGDGIVAHISSDTVTPELAKIEGIANGRAFRTTLPSTPVEINDLLSKFDELKNRTYSLLKFNCEHFARLLISGKNVSKQVGGVAIGGMSGCIIARKLGFSGVETAATILACAAFGLLLSNASS